MQKKLILTGYGTVAKEFIELIIHYNKHLTTKYGVQFVVIGITGSRGMIFEQDGIDLDILLECGAGSHALSLYAQKKGIPLQKTLFHQGDTLIECAPTDIETGEPGLTYMNHAIRLGMDIVTISKGALVHSYKELMTKANDKGVWIKFSGATAAALPTLDIGEYSLAGCTILRIEGILNGTSNFILTSMAENSLSYEKSLTLAQQKGIAESNPKLDVQGLDSASKILLLANGLLDANANIKDVQITGIENVTKQQMMEAKDNHHTIKLIASAEVENNSVTLTVRPQAIKDDHPLAHVHHTNKGIVFDTIEMGAVCATGGASHPRGAAAAALKDLINLYRN